MSDVSYWMHRKRRLSRRSALRGIATATGRGLTGPLLAGCSGRKPSGSGPAAPDQRVSQGAPTPGGTFNTYITQEPAGLDPQLVTYPGGEQITSGVQSRLFRYKTATRSGPRPNAIDDIESEPDLGLTAESPDAITWTVKLRTDAKFSNTPPVNGHAVEAEDIKATFTRALSLHTQPWCAQHAGHQSDPDTGQADGRLQAELPLRTVHQDAALADLFLDLPKGGAGMSLAIDRDALHRILYNNQFEDTVFLPGNMGKWSLHVSQLDAETGQYYKFDLNKAKQLLQSAGVLDQPFKWLYGNTTTGPQNDTMRNMLVAAGFRLATVVVDYQKDYIDSGKGIRQGYGWSKDWIVFAGQQPFTEPDEMLFNYWHSRSTQNEESLKDPVMDAMIDKERTLVNEDERLKSVLDIQRYIAKKVLILNSGTGKSSEFVQSRVQNWALATTMDGGVGTWTKVWLTR
ncbi:MAG TPA: hypothetical protein VK821_14270 [Dehalococcoidia bacterium]|nr:hypothetical protein [Dehalococcoidia bacterium]